MRAAFATFALAGLAVADPIAYPVPGGVSSAVAPNQSPPAGCYPNYDGTFLIGPVNVTSSKRDLSERDLDERNTQLGITLKNGILTDPVGRTGYVAANEQFQFDDPPQAGAIWTAGFSVCEDGRLTLGNDQYWYKCLSGDFFNLYFKSIGGQCIKSYLIARGIHGAGGPVPGSVAPVTSASTSAAASSASSVAGSSNSSSAASSSAVVTSTVVVGGGNGTASASGSSSASDSATITVVSSSTTVTKIVGGGHHTTTHATAGGKQTTTMGGKGTATKAPASSSSVASGLAPQATLKAELFGLAAGVLALAAL